MFYRNLLTSLFGTPCIYLWLGSVEYLQITYPPQIYTIKWCTKYYSGWSIYMPKNSLIRDFLYTGDKDAMSIFSQSYDSHFGIKAFYQA